MCCSYQEWLGRASTSLNSSVMNVIFLENGFMTLPFMQFDKKKMKSYELSLKFLRHMAMAEDSLIKAIQALDAICKDNDVMPEIHRW